MDAPLRGNSSPGNGGGSLSFHDPVLETLLDCFRGGDDLHSNCSVNDLFHDDPSTAPSAPPEIKVQPRVYSRFPLLPSHYTPPPAAEVVELQCLPAQPLLPADVVPSHLPHPDVPSHMLSTPFPLTDVAPHVSAPSMPPQPQPPSYPIFNTYQFEESPNALYEYAGSPSLDPHDHDFIFSSVETKHKNYLIHDASKLTPPMSMHHISLQNFMELELPTLEVPTSPIAYAPNGTTSPTYIRINPSSTMVESNSMAMDMSSISTLVASRTSRASLYWQSSLPQRASSSTIAPLPTPFLNKEKNAQMRSSTHGKYISKVTLRVKTDLLNLRDGYTWRKYGEKVIKKEKYKRSYFKCDKKERCKCEVVKRTQRCSDNEGYIMFTYEGRHTHPP